MDTLTRLTDAALTECAVRLRGAVGPLARSLRREGRGRFSPTELSVLGCIYRRGPISLGELAAQESLSAPMISKVVFALEQEGFVERRPDPSDRRINLVKTTRRAARWIEDGREERHARLADRISRLSEAEQEALAAALPALERLAVIIDD